MDINDVSKMMEIYEIIKIHKILELLWVISCRHVDIRDISIELPETERDLVWPVRTTEQLSDGELGPTY